MPNQGQTPNFTPLGPVFPLSSTNLASNPHSAIYVNPPPEILPSTPSKHTALYLFLGLLIFIFFAIGTVFAVLSAITYGYIDIDNPKLTQTFTHFVQDISFMPKTADYLLGKSAISHTSLTQHTFEINIRSTTSQSTQIIGNANYTNPQNPQTSFTFISPLSNTQYIFNQHHLFFTSQKPDNISFSSDPEWLDYDLNSQISSLQAKLSSSSSQLPLDNLSSYLFRLLTSPKNLKQIFAKITTLDGSEYYQFQISPDYTLVNQLYPELPIQISQLSLDIFLHTQSHLIKQVIISTQTNSSSHNSLTPTTIEVKLSDYHQIVDIKSPSLSKATQTIF